MVQNFTDFCCKLMQKMTGPCNNNKKGNLTLWFEAHFSSINDWMTNKKRKSSFLLFLPKHSAIIFYEVNLRRHHSN